MAENELITIHDTLFQVPMRYAAGHTLNEREANALNGALHSSLRNIWAPKVKAGLANGETPAQLQEKLDAYARDYQFGGRRRRHDAPLAYPDPALAIAMNMARARVREAVKAKDLGWSTAKITEAAKQLLDRQGPEGPLMTAARQVAEAERAAGEAVMAEVSYIVTSNGQAAA